MVAGKKPVGTVDGYRLDDAQQRDVAGELASAVLVHRAKICDAVLDVIEGKAVRNRLLHDRWWAVGCGSRGRVRLSACPLPGCFGTRVERLKGVKLVEATRDRSSTGCLEYWRGHTEYSGSAGLRRRPTFRPEPSFRRTPRVRLPRSENRPYSSYPPENIVWDDGYQESYRRHWIELETKPLSARPVQNQFAHIINLGGKQSIMERRAQQAVRIALGLRLRQGRGN